MLLEDSPNLPVSTYRPPPIHERVWSAWQRRKWLGIPIFIALSLLLALMITRMSDIYQATATILVERQKIPETFVQSTVTTGIDNQWLTLTQQVLTNFRLASLIERFNLYPGMRQKGLQEEEVILRMRKDVQVEQQAPGRMRRRKNRNNTTIAFTISYRSPNAEQAAQVTNTLASFYIDENVKVREEQATSTAEFLQAELTDSQKQLEDQEWRLSKFKEQYMGELPSQLPANQTALERFTTELRINHERQALINERRAVLSNQIQAAKEEDRLQAMSPAAPFDDGTSALNQLRNNLNEMRTTLGHKHPDVIKLKSEIAVREQRLAANPPPQRATRSARQPLSDYGRQLQSEYEQLAAELNALRTQERSLVKSTEDYRSRIDNTPRHERQLQILTRNYETTKSLYKSLLQRQKQAKLAENLEQQQGREQFRLIEPATLWKHPVAPNRSRLLIMSFMLAAAIAAAVIWLREMFDHSFHSLDDIRAFYRSRAPVLISLPYVVTPSKKRRSRQRLGLLAAATSVGLVLIAIASYAALKGKDQLYDLFVSLPELTLWAQGIVS